MTGTQLRLRGLNASQLKYLAAALMVVDHWNMLFVPLGFLAAAHPVLSRLFYFIGRMVFPLFAFFVAEGLRYTRNRRAYLLRLGLFGGITQLPFLLNWIWGSGSVIATFFLAAAGVFAYDALRKRLPGALAILPLLLCALLAHLVPTDYSWMGVLTVASIYFAGSERKRQLAVLAVCIGMIYLTPLWGSSLPAAVHWIAAAMAWLSVLLLAFCYNGERGNGNKWFFYWFYPAHLVVLGGLSMIL